MPSASQNSAIIIAHHGGRNCHNVLPSYQRLHSGIAQYLPENQALFSTYSNEAYLAGVDNPPIPALIDLLPELLANDNYQRIIIQPSLLVAARQYRMLEERIAQFSTHLKPIVLAPALIHNPQSYHEFAKLILTSYSQQDHEYLLIAHGGKDPGNNTLETFADVLAASSSRHHLLQLRKLEDLDSLVAKLNTANVTLVPFMMVTGYHFSVDIEIKLRKTLQLHGCHVEIIKHGLALLPELHRLLAQRILSLSNYTRID